MSDGFKDSGKRSSFETGAHRDLQDGKGRMDLLPFQALMKVSKVFEEGAKKYRANNWRRGIPLSRYADSGMRHMSKWMIGMRDEPHLDMACWNFLCLIETQELIKQGLLPESLNDLPFNPLDIEDNPLDLPELDLPLEGVELDDVGVEPCIHPSVKACEDQTGDAFYAAQKEGVQTGNSINGSIMTEEDLIKLRKGADHVSSDAVLEEMRGWCSHGSGPVTECQCDECEVPTITQKAAQMGFTDSVMRQAVEACGVTPEELDAIVDELPSVEDCPGCGEPGVCEDCDPERWRSSEVEAMKINQEFPDYVPLAEMTAIVEAYGPEDARVLAKGAQVANVPLTTYVQALKDIDTVFGALVGVDWEYQPEEGLEGKR